MRHVTTAGRGVWTGGGALPALGAGDRALLAVRERARAACYCSPTRRRCRTACSARPTTRASPSRSPARPAGRCASSRASTATARPPGSAPCRSAGWAACSRCSVAAALTLMLARGRRLGPPELPRSASCRRRAARTSSRSAACSRASGASRRSRRLKARAVALVGDRVGLGASASPDELRAAGERLGLKNDEAGGALRPRPDRRRRRRPRADAARGRIAAMIELRDRIRAEVGKVVVGQEDVVERLLARAARARPRPARRRAGRGEDAARERDRPRARPRRSAASSSRRTCSRRT